ncbi:MAG: hypothetical protein O2854_08575, partial [Chloroflexi bacterium]|nr:hypothetical protein [Chloroflexota bacterium]
MPKVYCIGFVFLLAITACGQAVQSVATEPVHTETPVVSSTDEPTSVAATPTNEPAISPTATRVPTRAVEPTPYPAVSQTEPTKVVEGAQPTCESGDVQLTHFYTDLSLIEMINPTIVTSGNWLKNRQYHKIVTDTGNNAPEVPVYAPADAVAIEVTHYLATMMPWTGEPYESSQYDIRFQASCEVFFWFDHLTRLAEPFASLAPAEGVRDTRGAAVSMSVPVEGGQLIGWTTGTDPAHVWDFILTDARQAVVFANQERYEKSGDLQNLLHTACPYDYYGPEMRQEFVDRFAWWGGDIGSTRCGGSVDV